MAIAMDNVPQGRMKRPQAEPIEYRFAYMASFGVILPVVAAQRLVPWNWLKRERLTIVEEARRAARSLATKTIPVVTFMD